MRILHRPAKLVVSSLYGCELKGIVVKKKELVKGRLILSLKSYFFRTSEGYNIFAVLHGVA